MTENKLISLLEEGLQVAKNKGVSQILISALQSEKRGVEVFEKELQSVSVADEVSVGVWLAVGDCWGASTCEGLSATNLKQAIDQAKLACEYSDPDPNYSLVEPSALQKDFSFDWDEKIFGLSMKDLEEQALLMEEQAINFSSQIKNISELGLSHTRQTRYLVNSQGLKHSESHGLLSVGLSAIAQGKSDRVVNAYEGESFRYLKDFEPKTWVDRVAAEAVGRLEPKSVQSGNYPVVLDSGCAAQLLRSFVSAFGGDYLYKGLSKLENKLGQKIAAPAVSLFQSPHQGLVPSVLDGEGTSTQELFLIKDGVFKNFFHNLYTARRAGVASTGNAAFSAGHAPGLSPLNLSWQGKSMSQKEIFKAMGSGLYVKELNGAMASPISGDFSYGALGYWVEGGQIAYPVADLTVAGNFFDMLYKIQAFGEKTRYHFAHTTGSYGGRDLWVEALAVSA